MKNGKRLLCVPGAERVWFAPLDGDAVQDGFFLPFSRETAPVSLFREAAARCPAAGRVRLAVTFPDVRAESRRFPAMTEDELAETLRWEADRLFRTDAPLAMDWTAVSRGPDGWDVTAAAVREDTLRPWAEGARAAGLRLSEAVPPVPSADECLVLLGRRRGAALYREGGGLAKRRFDAGTAPALSDFLAERGLSAVPLPLADCREEDWAALAGAAFTDGPDYDEALRAWARRLAGPPAMNLAFPEDRDQPFFSRRTRWLRLAQGACLAFALAALCFGASWVRARQALAAEETRAAGLTDAWRAMAAAQKADAACQAAREEGRAFIESDPHWEQKLLSLSEALPAGVTLRKITSDGGRIRLEGAAAESRAVPEFQSRLSAAWGTPCRVESLRREAGLPFVRFALLCTPAAGGAS